MGEVYLARDTRLAREVALKVLSPHLADTPEARARFAREARAVSSLNHPHICALYGVGRENGVDFLVLEKIDGETLAARLARGPLPTDQVHKLDFGLAVLKAVEDVASEASATPAQVALAWLAAQPAVAAPIASATSVKQVEELVGAMRLTLTADQLARLDVASRRPQPALKAK